MLPCRYRAWLLQVRAADPTPVMYRLRASPGSSTVRVTQITSDTVGTATHGRRVALFLSCDSFEGFFGGTFGLNREDYVTTYRNDFTWYYARGLARLGHEVTLYILSYGLSALHVVEDRLAVRFLHQPLWYKLPDAVLYRMRRVPDLVALRDRVAFMAYRRELHRALAEDRIELLYVQEFWTHRFDLIVRDVALPVIGADHGAQFRPGTAATKRDTLGRAYRLTCQDAVQLDLARCLGGNAVLLGNGVDTDFYAPPVERERTRTVITVGRLVDEQKRFSDLLRAMALLPEFNLTIVGSGPDDAMLRECAREFGVAERVRFAGFIASRNELRALYQSCNVFASASAWEAVALVMLEAMACGAAVVGTRIAAFEGLLIDGLNGCLVPVGNPAALAVGIRHAWEQAEKLGRQARLTVQDRYSAETLYRSLSSLIEAA